MTELPVTLPDIQTLTGLTMFLYMLTAAVHSAQLLPSRRFLPLLSIGMGVAVSSAAALAAGTPLPDAAVLGTVAGSLAPGLEETRKGVAEGTAKVRNRLQGGTDD